MSKLPSHRASAWVPGVALLLLFVVSLWGGYRLSWTWTGLSGDVQLWDWLEVLALPMALVIAPVLLRHRQRLTARHRAMVTTVLTLWIALVVAGYRVPWRWTGFTGNTLWD